MTASSHYILQVTKPLLLYHLPQLRFHRLPSDLCAQALKAGLPLSSALSLFLWTERVEDAHKTQTAETSVIHTTWCLPSVGTTAEDQ